MGGLGAGTEEEGTREGGNQGPEEEEAEKDPPGMEEAPGLGGQDWMMPSVVACLLCTSSTCGEEPCRVAVPALPMSFWALLVSRRATSFVTLPKANFARVERRAVDLLAHKLLCWIPRSGAFARECAVSPFLAEVVESRLRPSCDCGVWGCSAGSMLVMLLCSGGCWGCRCQCLCLVWALCRGIGHLRGSMLGLCMMRWC